MKIKPENSIDPLDPKYFGIPLWFVYGYECFPSMFCARIKPDQHTQGQPPVIWGYSVYKRVPGFRTLGVRAAEWIAKNGADAFAEQQHALDYLKKITTPKKAAL